MAEALSRERILDAAIDLVDRDGLDALNMRRLAAEIGVGTMSLYHYFPDKEALLTGIAEVVMADLERPPDDADWLDAAPVLAHSFRRIALAHPGVFPLLLGRKTPPAVMAAAVGVGTGLRRRGFNDETATLIFRVIVRFLIGWCMVETVGGPSGNRSRVTDREQADRQFSVALDAVLSGLAAKLAAPQVRS
jgi:AcrR family transcriptional regulator